jgi:hypothetical protein
MSPIPLKQFVQEEMQRAGLSRSGVFVRLYRGRYPWLQINRKNQRVVTVEESSAWLGLGALNDPLNDRPRAD